MKARSLSEKLISAGEGTFSQEVEDRYQAFKAKRIAPRLRLNWVPPKNSMRLALYFPTLERMFLRGKDYMADEAWVNAFVDLHRCATYIIELRKIHNAWKQPQYRKETQRMISVLVSESIDRCERCVRQIKLEIQMSMQAAQALEHAARVRDGATTRSPR